MNISKILRACASPSMHRLRIPCGPSQKAHHPFHRAISASAAQGEALDIGSQIWRREPQRRLQGRRHQIGGAVETGWFIGLTTSLGDSEAASFHPDSIRPDGDGATERALPHHRAVIAQYAMPRRLESWHQWTVSRSVLALPCQAKSEENDTNGGSSIVPGRIRAFVPRSARRLPNRAIS